MSAAHYLAVAAWCLLCTVTAHAQESTTPDEASAGQAGKSQVIIRSAPPIALGRPTEAVRIRGSQAMRWMADGKAFVELRRGARVYQGNTFIAGARLLIRITDTDTGAGTILC